MTITSPAPLRVLLFSTLYPSSERPGNGIFVETRLRELLKEFGHVLQAKVLAPVPWFPSKSERFGDHAAMARTPGREMRNGLDVLHPRYLVLPKIGMLLAPWLLAATALRAARQLRAEGFDFDLIDAHYFYPDGVAAAVVARAMGRPLVITARGSDLNLIARYWLPRRMMLWAARQAAACIGVSQALVDVMLSIGMPAKKLTVMRNGVDLERFHPTPQEQAQEKIGHLGQPLLLSVGNLVDLKGHDLCIDALALMRDTHPGARLLIVGAGPLKHRLAQHAEKQGVADRAHLVDPVGNADLRHWYSAADCLLLASSREGWPNVLLESMACSARAIGTAVGGVPEVISSPAAGRIGAERSAAALVNAVCELLAQPPQRADTARHASGFTWSQTSVAQFRLFNSRALAAG